MSSGLKIPKKEGGLFCPDRRKMNTQIAVYHRPGRESIPKLRGKIGETLLRLIAGIGQPDGWQQLEQLLQLRWQEAGL